MMKHKIIRKHLPARLGYCIQYSWTSLIALQVVIQVGIADQSVSLGDWQLQDCLTMWQLVLSWQVLVDQNTGEQKLDLVVLTDKIAKNVVLEIGQCTKRLKCIERDMWYWTAAVCLK